MEELIEALVRGVRRVEGLGFSQVLALVNPRAYFLALAAAVAKCGFIDRWVLFRPPAHPRYLISSVRQVIPFARAAAEGCRLPGGIYFLPELVQILHREAKNYRHRLPTSWREWDALPSAREVKKEWRSLVAIIRGSQV